MVKKLILYYDSKLNPCKKKDAYFIKVYSGDYGMDIYLSNDAKKMLVEGAKNNEDR